MNSNDTEQTEWAAKAKEFGADFRIGRHGFCIKTYLKWMLNIGGAREFPKPMLVVPLDGWITDPEEIKRAIMLDDEMGIKRDGN